MDIIKEYGRKGAKITNSKLTPRKRSRASKKGWKLRKERLALMK